MKSGRQLFRLQSAGGQDYERFIDEWFSSFIPTRTAARSKIVRRSPDLMEDLLAKPPVYGQPRNARGGSYRCAYAGRFLRRRIRCVKFDVSQQVEKCVFAEFARLGRSLE